ncbi:hypothetical protein N7536_012485 [Penicillium majusculum]|nr:hypothetical protein N7536_012485 [Penicillium majusculum]
MTDNANTTNNTTAAPAAGPTTGPATVPTTVPLYGPGAPADRNWDAVDELQHKAPDQAYQLPDPKTIKLFPITPPLSHRDDYDACEAMVVNQLKALRLRNLIDDKILSPYRNTRNVERWITLSERACSWLSYGLDPAVNREINLRSGNIRWADKFMHEQKFFGTRRSEFNTIEEFITGVQTRFKTARDLNGHVVPYHMMVIIALDLSKIPERESFINMKNNELGRNPDPGSKLTTDDVRAYYREIIEKAAWENYLKNCATK